MCIVHYLAVYVFLYGIESISPLHSHRKTLTGHVSYEGAQVWKTNMRDIADITVIKKLMNNRDLSVWLLTPEEAIYLVQPERKLKVYRLLSAQGMNHTVVIMDVQRRIDEQAISSAAWDSQALRRGHRMNWRQYPEVEVINEYLNYLAKEYPSVCKLKSIGRTIQNRTINLMKISNGNPKNNAILVVAGQHAREWIAITSAMLIVREIVTKFDDQSKYLQNVDWYVIPLLNPDGYHYSYTADRLWRKNRKKIDESCYGVDLNRNFGSSFDITGITDHNHCGEIYCGPRAFSELETVALRKVILKNKKCLKAVVDMHSFGQMIMFPWSAKAEETPDLSLHETTASGMAKAIYEFKRRSYDCGPTYHLIYPATGSLLDWSYSQGIHHSYVIEGRDQVTSSFGFLVPPIHIQEAGQEMLIAVKHLAKVLNDKNKTTVEVKNRQYRWF